MNIKPKHYLQTDPRWSSKPYRTSQEKSTVGGSGCGPTAAACIIETMTGKTFTPEDACNWSMAHGYKATGNGTYYAYFEPQFAEFGIVCKMLNWTKTYGNPNHPNHQKIFDMLKDGYYAIAVMGKGLWTKSGHFIVLWWEDGKVRIVDPASTRSERLNGDLNTFKSQVCYYWWIDAREFNKNGIKPIVPTQPDSYDTYTVVGGDSLSKIGKKVGVNWQTIAELNNISAPYMIYPGQVLKIREKSDKEDTDMAMDQNTFNKMFATAMASYRGNLQDNDSGEWSKKSRKFVSGSGMMVGAGSINGNPNMMWEDFLTREQAAALFYRFAELIRSGYFDSAEAAQLFEELAAMQ